MKYEKLQVGQEIWCVPYDSKSPPAAVTVAKAGRKWATLEPGYGRVELTPKDNGEIDIDFDFKDSTGQEVYASFFVSKEAHDRFKTNEEIGAALHLISHVITYHTYRNLNPDITLADIQEAARLLRVDLPKESA